MSGLPVATDGLVGDAPENIVLVPSVVTELNGTIITNKLTGFIKCPDTGEIMSAAVTLYRGDNRTLEVTVKDETGTVVNLTGASARFSIKKSKDDISALVSKSTAQASEILISNPAGGILAIFIVPNDTVVSLAGRGLVFQYDVEVTLQNSKIFTVLQDTFTILLDIST